MAKEKFIIAGNPNSGNIHAFSSLRSAGEWIFKHKSLLGASSSGGRRAKSASTPRANIDKACKGHIPTAYGFVWVQVPMEEGHTPAELEEIGKKALRRHEITKIDVTKLSDSQVGTILQVIRKETD